MSLAHVPLALFRLSYFRPPPRAGIACEDAMPAWAKLCKLSRLYNLRRPDFRLTASSLKGLDYVFLPGCRQLFVAPALQRRRQNRRRPRTERASMHI